MANGANMNNRLVAENANVQRVASPLSVAKPSEKQAMYENYGDLDELARSRIFKIAMEPLRNANGDIRKLNSEVHYPGAAAIVGTYNREYQGRKMTLNAIHSYLLKEKLHNNALRTAKAKQLATSNPTSTVS